MEAKTHVEAKPHITYGTYLMVWFSLLVLTAATIIAAGLQFGQWSVLAAIAIATVKGTLVLLYFMHLKYEPAMFKVASIVALLTLTIIMVVTFTDFSFR